MTTSSDTLYSAREGFLIGWLDALWLGLSDGKVFFVPEDVRRELVRYGWLKYTGPVDLEDGARPVNVTPLGASTVVAANGLFGIRRTGIGEGG